MEFVVIWSDGHQVTTCWDRAQAVCRHMQRARPDESVRVELAESYAARAFDERRQDMQRGAARRRAA